MKHRKNWIIISFFGILFATSCRNRSSTALKGAADSIPPLVKDVNLTTADGIWAQIVSDTYDHLPLYEVSIRRFLKSVPTLAQRARLTIARDDDIWDPPFEKLVHANGICMKGTWKMKRKVKGTAAHNFTGAFAPGTEAPFIGRVSVAFGEVMSLDTVRAFGFAGKVFPLRGKAANFFTLDDFAGTRIDNYQDTKMRNSVLIGPKGVWNVFEESISDLKGGRIKDGLVATAAETLKILFPVDKNRPHIRQLYQLSELGLKDKTKAITPRWMRISSDTKQKEQFLRAGNSDFRNDLKIDRFPNKKIIYNVDVASTRILGLKRRWIRVGHIEIADTRASFSCDKRLHFQHPKWKESDEIRYTKG